MAHALVVLINVIWKSDVLPDIWKLVKIVPIFKGGDECELGDYRGITLLSVISKVMEALVYERLVKYIERSNGLLDEQWGFREGRSTIDLIFMVSEILEKRRENKKKTFICFIDVIKAYDTVWVDGLSV